MALITSSIKSAFPMDTAVVELASDGLPVYDRACNATALRDVLSRMVTDGVYPDYLDELRPYQRGGAWYVGPGGAVCAGLYVPVGTERKVADQSDVPTGQYLYLCVAGRFDMSLRDGAVYARLSASPSEQPVRTESTHELIIARVDWRGTLTDLRADGTRCGFVSAVSKIDAESFMAELKTAVSQFNLNVGSVTTLPPGTTPEVVVRKPEMAGEPVYIDFGIPRGPKGDRGEDGSREPALWIRPESDPPPMHPDDVWMVDDKATHVIGAIRAAEVDEVYPAPTLYPGASEHPGGTMQWVAHTLAAALIESE